MLRNEKNVKFGEIIRNVPHCWDMVCAIYVLGNSQHRVLLMVINIQKEGDWVKVRRMLKCLAACALAAALCFCGGALIKGYYMYRAAIEEVCLEDKVSAIQAKENYTAFDQLPEIYVDAVLSVEDHRFYSHPGIDVIAIARAAFNDIRAGAFVEGGSTVTQQLAKNLYFTQEKELERKVAEMFLAFDLERSYSKNEILELYVNTIYFGNGYYCVRDASQGYFGKEPEDMTDCESTLLAGVPNAPSCYAPTVSPRLAAQRQAQVVARMVKCGYFTEERAHETLAAEIDW